MSIPQVTPPTDLDELLWSQDENLARMFAASEAFQSEVGVDGEANPTLVALNDHVMDWKSVEDDNFEKCRIIIEYGPMSRSLNGTWSTSGTIPVMIERWQPMFESTNAGYRESKANFMRFVSKVLKQVEDRSYAVSEDVLGFSPMRFNSYSLVAGPETPPASELDYGDVGIDESARKVLWWIEFSFQVN